MLEFLSAVIKNTRDWVAYKDIYSAYGSKD